MSTNSTPELQTPSPERKAPLRRDFITMLFALSASQVAIFAYAVFEAAPPEAGCGAAGVSWCRLAAISHLALALLVVATSWVGWSRSSSADNEVHRVFDRDFIPWVIDVLLVVLYFFLASSVEVKGGLDSRDFMLMEPSVRPEAWWTLWLMALYAIWDASTKWFPRDVAMTPLERCKNAVATSFASLCTVAALWILWGQIRSRSNLSGATVDARDAVLLDVALMALVVLFRVLKSAEVVLFERALPWRKLPSKVDPEPSWIIKIVGLLATAGACYALCFWPWW